MRLVLVGKDGPAFRERAARVWLVATAAHGARSERDAAVNALAALGGGAVLGAAAQRWLERVASGHDIIKREWARSVLLRAKREDAEAPS